MYRKLGPDTGADMIAVTDCSAHQQPAEQADQDRQCPKVILYNLNPADFDMLEHPDGTLPG